jgi:hypothetical protein
MKRLIFVTAVSRVAYLKDAVDLLESAQEHAETSKSFEQLVDYLASVEAKNKRIKPRTVAAAATVPAAKAKAKSAAAESKSAIMCANCGKRGHKRSECKLPKSTELRCYNCGQVGHRKVDCPTLAASAVPKKSVAAAASKSSRSRRAQSSQQVAIDAESSSDLDSVAMICLAGKLTAARDTVAMAGLKLAPSLTSPLRR